MSVISASTVHSVDLDNNNNHHHHQHHHHNNNENNNYNNNANEGIDQTVEYSIARTLAVYNASSDNMDGSSSSASSVVLSPHDWDPQFHGSVHTATIAVCIVLVIFVVILGTFGNGLVLLSSFQSRKRRSNFDVLIYNLAAVDFIICSCLSPTFLYLLFSDPPSAKGFCGGYLFVCTACGLQSLLTLVAIAAYRQSRIRGLRGSLTSAKVTLILLSTYTVCFASAIGSTLQVTLSRDPPSSNCQNIINSSQLFTNNVVLYFISPIVIISFILITSSYIVIAKAVKLQTTLRTKSIQTIVKSTTIYRPLAPTGPLREYNLPQDMHQIAPEKIITTSKKHPNSSSNLRSCTCCNCAAAMDKENKAVSMCYVVILIIALCWTPLIISHLVELITGESIIIFQVKLCGIALVFLNSALDPYMYAQNNTSMKRRYARVFWDLLRCECRAPPKPKFRTSSPGFLIPKTSPNVPIYAEEGFLPFLQPKYKTPRTVLGPYPRIDIDNTRLNVNDANHHNRMCYHNKIATKGASRNNLLLPPSYNYNHAFKVSSGLKQYKNGNPQTTSMKTLVPQNCCNGNSPDDQSLDSSFPH